MSTDKEAPEIISFERYLVCFVDLLGSTKAIEKDEMNFFVLFIIYLIQQKACAKHMEIS